MDANDRQRTDRPNDMLRIGIDLDATITASPQSMTFFRLLTHSLKGKARIHIITDRELGYEDETRKELEGFGIRYDVLVHTSEKADFILKNGISIHFDDVDDYFLGLPESVTIFKTRVPDNFDFAKKKWIYEEDTGYMVD